jgi:phosphatidylserine decarboxylase
MMPDLQTWKMIFSGRVHPEGWIFISISLLLAAVSSWLSFYFSALFLLIGIFMAYFFRDPHRVAPDNAEAIVAPADGLVMEVSLEPALDDSPLQGMYHRVSIFLNIWDVHVNRSPCNGQVVEKQYIKGKFGHAALSSASFENERQTLFIQSSHGLIGCVQIAGFVARRIVCQVEEGDILKTGDRFGLIRFGSRVDVWIPQHYTLWVKKGQKMVAGETILALFDRKSDEEY